MLKCCVPALTARALLLKEQSETFANTARNTAICSWAFTAEVLKPIMTATKANFAFATI